MTNPTKTVVVHRLSAEVFAKLESKFRPLVVTETTSPLQVARQLGINDVLSEIRKGIVVENTNAAA